MRGFLGAGLKSNPHLSRAVVTGILRIAKESLFSDVNNISVFTLLAAPFNKCFGFTEEEVAALLERTESLKILARRRPRFPLSVLSRARSPRKGAA
jgi:hypothetical protein